MNEQTAIPVSIPDVDHRGQFYVLLPSFWSDGIGPGLEIANEDALILPGMFTVEPPNGDPRQYPVRPHLVHVPDEGGLPRDFESLAGIWIVSQALKEVFESVDPQGFAFVACDFSLADGSPGPQYYLCDVIRSLDALDPASSRVKIKTEHDYITGQDMQLYSIAGGASLVFKADIVGCSHIFRQLHGGFAPICDRTMFDALSLADLEGVRLRDCSAL
jgi:hypothetical protein